MSYTAVATDENGNELSYVVSGNYNPDLNLTLGYVYNLSYSGDADFFQEFTLMIYRWFLYINRKLSVHCS